MNEDIFDKAGANPTPPPMPPEQTPVVQEQAPVAKKRKMHPTLGEYITVTVIPMHQMDIKSVGFVSVGSYTSEFNFNTKIQMPEKAILVLEDAAIIDRSLEEFIDEDGKPATREIETAIPKFNVIKH